MTGKQPLGVIPKHIYEIQRVQELCRALYEYSFNNTSEIKIDTMIEWVIELSERLDNLKIEGFPHE